VTVGSPARRTLYLEKPMTIHTKVRAGEGSGIDPHGGG
jgi:hypothetical protein